MTKDEIVQLVRNYLQDNPLPNAMIEVLDQGVRQDEDWWYVPVRPDRDFPRTYQYYDILAGIEDAITDEDHINILLVPSA